MTPCYSQPMRTLKIFHSFDEADKADRAYYASLRPQQRLDIVLELGACYRESFGEAGQRFERVYRAVELDRR